MKCVCVSQACPFFLFCHLFFNSDLNCFLFLNRCLSSKESEQEAGVGWDGKDLGGNGGGEP